jgi:hypothetical protein
VTTNHIGVFHDFLTLDQLTILIQAPRLEMTLVNGHIAFHYDFFMDTFRYILALVTVNKAPPGGPFKMAPFFYGIQINHLLATVISRKMDNPKSCLLFDFDGFVLKTGEEPRFMALTSNFVNVTTVRRQPMMTLEKVNVPFEFELCNPSLLSQEDRNSTSLCIHKWITALETVHLVYHYHRQSAETFLDVFQSFFAPVIDPRPNPFALKFDTVLNVENFDMIWSDLTYIAAMKVTKLWYRIFERHDLTCETLNCFVDEKQFAATQPNTVHAVTFVRDVDGLTCVLENLSIDWEYELVARLTTALWVGPLLRWRVRPPPPDEPPNVNWVAVYRLITSRFVFPVGPQDSDILLLDFDAFAFTLGWQRKCYEVNELVARFAASPGSQPWGPNCPLTATSVHC